MFVAKEWKNYLSKYTQGNPADLKKVSATGDQLEYMLMQAFYAGFGACFGVVNNIVEAGEEDDQCDKMSQIMHEIEAFSEWQRELAKKMGVATTRVHIRAGKDEN